MSARDDYAKLDATTRGLHHQGQTSTEAQAALDELDRLRAELADTPTLVRVDGVMWCVEHDDMAYEGNDRAAAFHDREPEGTEGEPCDLRPLGYVS